VSTQRHFIALDPPDSVRGELARLREELDGIRWSPPEQLHVTLRFLGEVPEERKAEAVRRLSEIRVEPFVLPIEGVGVFPPKGPPRVIWAGTGRGHPRLFQLRQRIDDALIAAGLDFDLRTFHAHVTLGRCGEDSARGVKGWRLRHEGFVGAPFRVDHFSLYESLLNAGAAEYRCLRRFALGLS
jgi:2'-5' RNA ligase